MIQHPNFLLILQHTDPDYSCAYVTITTAKGVKGNGLTFTCGRGTEIVVAAVKSLSPLVIGKSVIEIYKEFATFWRSLTSESQLRWVRLFHCLIQFYRCVQRFLKR